ncbi:tRNA dihydrouridine synthase DusB [Motiliproteus coralliicola]|uniref:tRNA-dihydrouridine synthase B n=1 Tax=Motiliproteus coralliicola TaxID=2283196 RepID=A0A369WD29_9GAMM|nr:tRNA dihydrouridine synthase DusB [Motiliproteus coralliicola]RDE19940.1 tRNA dihydrouridine synthase DusB [Motiliproteus coralliicola]
MIEVGVFQIGPYNIDARAVLAPMAGVTDLPFRRLCREHGAGLTPSEMVTADKRLWNSRKSRSRLNHDGEAEPRTVQIAGGDPQMLAEAAQLNVERGAQIIDINMGCPAKKVCNKAAGSALLRDEALVRDILQAVVDAVEVPVTLKIRTGWDPSNRNGVRIARIAEQSGIASLAVHGRTRACGYRGQAEYDTIADIRQAISIPLLANGDIDSPAKARSVLDHTGADAVMIGRPAQGRPWIFTQINHFLATGEQLPEPDDHQVEAIMQRHLTALHGFYGEVAGVRIARKHLGWYLAALPQQSEEQATLAKDFRRRFNLLEQPQPQLDAVGEFFTARRPATVAA